MDFLKYWKPETFEISSYKYGLDGRKGKSFKTSGSDNTGICTYTYNELGFRGDSPYKDGFKIMSIGCSLTEGVGVNDNETWSHQFAKLIPNSLDLNFGCGGRSNDFISRCLLSYYDLVKPDLVLIMYTSPQRREIYTEDGGIEPFIPTLSWGYLKETEQGQRIQNLMIELQNENQDLINWYKNHQLINLFLKSKNCNWLWNGSFGIPKSYKELNRFDGDYMNQPLIDYGVEGSHPGPLHNKEYSKKLLNYIQINFPNYLPSVS